MYVDVLMNWALAALIRLAMLGQNRFWAQNPSSIEPLQRAIEDYMNKNPQPRSGL